MQTMYYIGLDVHKRPISYCVKDANGANSSGLGVSLSELLHGVDAKPSKKP